MNYLISKFIDNELDLDDKIEFVGRVHEDNIFKDESTALLEMEKIIRTDVVDHAHVARHRRAVVADDVGPGLDGLVAVGRADHVQARDGAQRRQMKVGSIQAGLVRIRVSLDLNVPDARKLLLQLPRLLHQRRHAPRPHSAPTPSLSRPNPG